MKKMEQIELNAYHNEIVDDMRSVVQKYRRRFGWDIPEIDQAAADDLIVTAMHQALEDIAVKLAE
jgi:hypothetical protein